MKVIGEREVRAIRKLYVAVKSTRRVGKFFGISSAAVSYWLRNDKNSTKPRPPAPTRAGCDKRRSILRKLVAETVVIDHHKHPKFSSASELCFALAQLHGIRVSKTTIQSDLKALGYVSRVRPGVPDVSPALFAKRKSWANRHKHLDPKSIIFSDEKMFVRLGGMHKRQYVRKGCKPLVREKAGYPNKLLVWGAIGINFRHLVLLKGTGPAPRDTGT